MAAVGMVAARVVLSAEEGAAAGKAVALTGKAIAVAW